MGILDEAIREHLELKRRGGTDPSEIERLEREALGPVRRSPHGAIDVMTDEPTAAAGAYPIEEEVPGWDQSLEEPAPFDHTSGRPDEALPPAEPWPGSELGRDFDGPALGGFEPEPEPDPDAKFSRPRHHEIAEEWEAHERQGLAGETAGLEPDSPAPAPPPPTPAAAATPPPAPSYPASEDEGEVHLDPRGPEPIEQETAEYNVEAEEHGSAESAEGDDVLEETPDFLQDTPDHDRLWFEQRPPRDFDFDS